MSSTLSSLLLRRGLAILYHLACVTAHTQTQTDAEVIAAYKACAATGGLRRHVSRTKSHLRFIMQAFVVCLCLHQLQKLTTAVRTIITVLPLVCRDICWFVVHCLCLSLLGLMVRQIFASCIKGAAATDLYVSMTLQGPSFASCGCRSLCHESAGQVMASWTQVRATFHTFHK